MSIFVPNKVYLRGILLHYFIQKKSAAEAHRILVQTYGDNALSDTTCRDWFRRFKNNDFELEDKERSGAPKKFQDKELEQSLDEDPSQTLSEFGKILQVDESTVSKRLKGLGMIQKQGHWVPYKLKPRDVKRRFGTCELLLQRQKRKGFLTLRPHVAKPVKTYLETLKWEVLPHPPHKNKCSKNHREIFLSNVILIIGLYFNFSVEKNPTESNINVALEFKNSGMWHYFCKFYDNIITKLKSFGEIKTLKCYWRNKKHWRANLYVQYDTKRAAAKAWKNLKGRSYNGKPLVCKFVNVKSLRSVVCSLTNCLKSNEKCNYLHISKILHNKYDIKNF
ncbi:MOS1T transposase, partial [Pseudoatta argentina]